MAQNFEVVLNNNLLFRESFIDLDIDISFFFQPIYRKIVTSINPNGISGNSNCSIVFQKTVSDGIVEDHIVLRIAKGICKELEKDSLVGTLIINP